jgi:hypothetical protein
MTRRAPPPELEVHPCGCLGLRSDVCFAEDTAPDGSTAADRPARRSAHCKGSDAASVSRGGVGRARASGAWERLGRAAAGCGCSPAAAPRCPCRPRCPVPSALTLPSARTAASPAGRLSVATLFRPASVPLFRDPHAVCPFALKRALTCLCAYAAIHPTKRDVPTRMFRQSDKPPSVIRIAFRRHCPTPGRAMARRSDDPTVRRPSPLPAGNADRGPPTASCRRRPPGQPYADVFFHRTSAGIRVARSSCSAAHRPFRGKGRAQL